MVTVITWWWLTLLSKSCTWCHGISKVSKKWQGNGWYSSPSKGHSLQLFHYIISLCLQVIKRPTSLSMPTLKCVLWFCMKNKFCFSADVTYLLSSNSFLCPRQDPQPSQFRSFLESPNLKAPKNLVSWLLLRSQCQYFLALFNNSCQIIGKQSARSLPLVDLNQRSFIRLIGLRMSII